MRYRNPDGGMELSAELIIPSGEGTHPGVVLFSVAGTAPLVERLVAEGYAVLTPALRGFVEVEPLLAASFGDLSGDVGAALEVMGMRDEVDGGRLTLIAQSDLTAPALVWAGASETAIPLILLAPPAFSGVEVFRAQQMWLAERQGTDAAGLAAVGRYVDEIAEVVLGERTPYAREYRLRTVRARSRVDLPRNAEFPDDDRQAHFFASPLWHDRLAFDPEPALAAVSGPLLVLIGADDPRTPMAEYLEAVRGALSTSDGRDTTVCRIPGRTRHVFTPEGVRAITEWLAPRTAADGVTAASGDPRPPAPCLEDGEEGA